MPVKIGTIQEMTPDEFAALRRQRGRKADPAMEALLDRVAAGVPQRVTLDPGQSARGVRIAISRKARERGLSVETVEGDGFVAVAKADERTVARRSRRAAAGRGRRGRRKQDEVPEAIREGLSETME